MARYIIEHHHTAADCVKSVDACMQAGAHFLAATDWGCKVGVHTGWTTIEAETDAEARNMVPPLIRSMAKPVRLHNFTPKEVFAFHQDLARAF